MTIELRFESSKFVSQTSLWCTQEVIFLDQFFEEAIGCLSLAPDPIRQALVSVVDDLADLYALAGIEAVTTLSFVLNDWVDKLISRINTAMKLSVPA